MRIVLAICTLLILATTAFCGDSDVPIRNVLVSGDLPETDPVPFSEDAFRSLAANESSFERIANTLVEYYNERGYPFAQVCLDDLELTAADMVDVTLRVVVGPLSHFDTCRVEGVDRQTAAYLVRISDIHPGERFSQGSIEASKRIFRSHRFLAVDDSVTLDFHDDFTRCVPGFRLRKLPTNLLEGSLGYQPAYGSQSAFVRGFARLEFENPLGRGRRFSIRYNKKNPVSHEVAFGFYQPFVFYQPLSVSFNLEQLKFDSLYQKISFDSGIEYAEAGNVSIRVKGGWSRYTPEGSAFRGIFHSRRWWWGIGSTVKLNSGDVLQVFDLDISYGIKRQYRFAGFAPERARTTDTRLEGGYELRTPLSRSLRHRLYLTGAAIVTDETKIPPSDLYKLGGARNLRGYREDQFFCERFALYTMQPELNLARGATFHLFSDGAWFRQSIGDVAFRWGAGAGFEFMLPTGKLLVDIAWGKDDSFGDGKLYVVLESRF